MSVFLDETYTDSINRVAFPYVRVFVFGKEVTEDVMSVRVNQAGGSTERTPSTCSVTLANVRDRYILNHSDIINVGKAKSMKAGESGIVWRSQVTRTDSETGNETVYSKGSVDFPLSGGTITLDPVLISQLSTQLATASDEELLYTVQACISTQGYSEITLSDAKVLKDKMLALRNSMRDEVQEELFAEYREEDVGYNLKQQVISEKMVFTRTLETSKDTNPFLTYPKKMVWDYPMQEGDCIFHANDGVRIIWRDPFDPRIWYWGFAGFIDTWTDESDVNKASTVTLTCTDVSKMARYAVVQLKAGLLDGAADINRIIDQALGSNGAGGTAANSELTFSNEIFADMSVLEVLETIFFGSKSALDLIKATAIYSITEDLEDLYDDELRSFIISNLGIPIEEALKLVPSNSVNPDLSTETQFYEQNKESFKKIMGKVNDYLQAKAWNKITDLNWPGITTPRGVEFKRYGQNTGVAFYVLGTKDEADNASGAIEVKDLYSWNEEIHHRVRIDDLTLMHKTTYPVVASHWTIDKVITQIGTNTKDYPIGGGRVFYFAPAGISSVLGDGVLDKALTNTGSLHSIFKDRLSYLYDIAEAVNFCFYATPRGDLVFEMPLYDYDPQDFWKSKDTSTTGVSQSFSGVAYESIFKQAYSGNYSTSDLTSLTEMSFVNNAEDQALIDWTAKPVFDYSKHFTIEPHEQMSYSNTSSDRGVVTAYRTLYNYFQNYGSQQNVELQGNKYASVAELIPTLGFRIDEGSMWGYITGEEAAELYSALMLNKLNADARNMGVDILPRFGLMVNRPIFWKHRNYYATIASASHSLTWNSEASTSVNLYHIRGWTGEFDAQRNKPKMKHYGDTDRPFNIVNFMAEAKEMESKSGKSGV
jgi:hypothetical protein